MLDHTAAFAAFPNGGLAVTAHAALEVRSADGRVIWRADRDLPKPRRVFSQQVAADMNMMLNKAVEEGTGRRTILPGIKTSGKTGTTNAYRDAWFNGYSGNMTAAIWVGNDDYAPTNRMTGGSLPGMIWQQVMAYAHQGVEIKPYPGVAPAQPGAAPQAAVQTETTKAADYVPPPQLLTRKGADILVRIEKMLEDATKAMPARRRPDRRPRLRAVAAPRSADVGAAAAGADECGAQLTSLRRRVESSWPGEARSAKTRPSTSCSPRQRKTWMPGSSPGMTSGIVIGLNVRFLLGLIFSLAVAAVVGLGLTLASLQRGVAFGAFTIGAWTSWPRNGTAEIDPYARANVARSGCITHWLRRRHRVFRDRR